MKRIYLDVDGVLNPDSRSRPTDWDDYRKHQVHLAFAGKHNIWLSRSMAETIASVAQKHRAEICWLTTWSGEANYWISPIFDWPELRVIRYDERTTDSGLIISHGKIHGIKEDCGLDAVVWIDDGLGSDAREWAEERTEPTLLVTPNSSRGLLKNHLDVIDEFFEAW